jgi:hypothetical protein
MITQLRKSLHFIAAGTELGACASNLSEKLKVSCWLSVGNFTSQEDVHSL